jgi:hypothetical protein
VAVRLSSRARRALRTAGSVRLALAIAAVDEARNRAVVRRTITVRAR